MDRIHELLLHPFVFPVVISLFLLWSITKWLRKPVEKTNLPPSPPKLPILIGNLLPGGRLSLPHQNLYSLAQKHGPLLLLQLGPIPMLVVSSADAAREIMRTHDLNFANRASFKVQKKLLYNGKNVSLAPYGEYWRQVKRIVVLQLLSNKRVQSFRSIREEETSILMNKIREHRGRPLNLTDLFSQFTNYVICKSAFGGQYNHESENSKKFLVLLDEFSDLLGTVTIGDFVPWLSWISRVNGFDKKVDRFVKRMDDFLEGVIRDRLETIEDDKNIGDNFLDILLGIYTDNTPDISIDRDSIKAILLDIFSAGVETTSTAIEWAMAELLRHPTIMEILQNEVREIIKDKNDITDDDLEKMQYLKAVIKETLRCHPPIPLLVPKITAKDVKIKGYDVSAGTLVITNVWAIGRDPLSWDKPEKFEPHRFLNSSIDFKGLDFELIPFGAGRRSCPGIAFSNAAIEFVIANLVHKFNWELPDGVEGKDLDMAERSGVTVRKNIPLLATAT
ncbi:hypothetical protein DH2020_030635 [Rehmannia glutinosa]|uniref:Cytochrome P450 n=1 Tax=Rehmannia glutinosa TaxID=99300 RepID=A0ABR0VKB2_REHGL